MTADRSVTVVMPVYNEAALLAPAVTAVGGFLGKRPAWRYEILIVESGSTDGTGDVADRLAASTPCVRVIHEGAKRGFGSALRLGWAEAACTWVWLVTADVPFPLEAFDEAAGLAGQHDAILSYRTGDPRGIGRRFRSAVFNALVKTVLRLHVRSVNSAFKLLRTDLVRSLPLTSNGWLIDAEVLYWMERAGARWTEIPVRVIERTSGRSTVGVATPIAVIRELVHFLRTKDARGASVRTR